MTRDEIAAMFERRQAAYDRKDAAALVGDYAADCVIESPSGGTHHGAAAAEKVLRAVFDGLDVALQQECLIVDGNSVAQVVRIEGRDVGQFLGLPPTGKAFRVPGVFLYTLNDSRIVRERRIYDYAGLLLQTGLLKAKPAVS
jgi:predicted ester cyclase